MRMKKKVNTRYVPVLKRSDLHPFVVAFSLVFQEKGHIQN